MRPVAGWWSVDYSPSLFSYWNAVDPAGLDEWIRVMNELYPD